jgi:hypothetical protein
MRPAQHAGRSFSFLVAYYDTDRKRRSSIFPVRLYFQDEERSSAERITRGDPPQVPDRRESNLTDIGRAAPADLGQIVSTLQNEIVTAALFCGITTVPCEVAEPHRPFSGINLELEILERGDPFEPIPADGVSTPPKGQLDVVGDFRPTVGAFFGKSPDELYICFPWVFAKSEPQVDGIEIVRWRDQLISYFHRIPRVP